MMSEKVLVFVLLVAVGVVVGVYIPPGPKWKCPPATHVWPCVCHTPSDLGISLDCKDVRKRVDNFIKFYRILNELFLF